MNNKLVPILIVAVVAFVGGYFTNGVIGGGNGKIQSESQVNLSNDWDSLSYFIGLTIGYQTQGLFEDIDAALVGSGINTVLTDSSEYDVQASQMIAGQLQQSIVNKKTEEANSILESKKNEEGVFETESGLLYQPLVEGDGQRPADTSVVTVHYHGTFIDGKVFDSSVERGEPFQFTLKGGVIQGWIEGVQLMTVGSKYKFYIPSHLAYGPRGNRGIPPNTPLVFEVELLSIDE